MRNCAPEGVRSTSYDVQLHIIESILTVVVMDSGPAPSGASRNDEGVWISASTTFPPGLVGHSGIYQSGGSNLLSPKSSLISMACALSAGT